MIYLSLLVLPVQPVIVFGFLFQVSIYLSTKPVFPILLLSEFLLQTFDFGLGMPAQPLLFLLQLVPFLLQSVVVGVALSKAFFCHDMARLKPMTLCYMG